MANQILTAAGVILFAFLFILLVFFGIPMLIKTIKNFERYTVLRRQRASDRCWKKYVRGDSSRAAIYFEMINEQHLITEIQESERRYPADWGSMCYRRALALNLNGLEMSAIEIELGQEFESVYIHEALARVEEFRNPIFHMDANAAADETDTVVTRVPWLVKTTNEDSTVTPLYDQEQEPRSQ